MKKRYVYKQDLDPIAEEERFNKLVKLISRDPKIIEDLDMADVVRLKLFYDQKQVKAQTATAKTTQSEKVKKLLSNVEIKPGDMILHRKFGKGKIKVVTDTRLIVEYPSVGKKTLDRAWCEKNCKIIKGEHV
ncbi:hypothetical protein [Blautia sp.]